METKKIKTIAVEQLFGNYSYTLTIPSAAKDNVFILYGDNGTGKSTILRLAYHLLSNEVGHAHKTYLANTVFKSFKVEFEDEIKVWAERDEESEDFTGNFSLNYEKGEESLSCDITTEWSEENHQYRILFSASSSENRIRYHQILHKLSGFNVFYISDSRNAEQRKPMDARHRRQFSSSDPVEREMGLLHEWVVSQALESSKKGEEGTSEVYAKVLSKLGRNTKSSHVMAIDEIVKEIETLESRALSYSLMGFISDTSYADIKTRLSKVTIKNRETASNILVPYLETQKKRLDALDHLFATVDYLMESLNDYLYKKNVTYSIREGFRFYQKNDEEGDDPFRHNPKDAIDIKRLSSGERQLLRLFGMVIRKSNECPIIIIDEPEISLNIKWQRRLLSTLNYFVRDSGAQFVVATHSFEILASHRANTVKVGDTYTPKNNG